jgi:hypothetical protein
MKARNLNRLKGNKGKNHSLVNKRNKRTTIGTTKADKVSHGIIDIEDTPDASVWSRHLAEGNVTGKISEVQGPIVTQMQSANKRRNITKRMTRRKGIEDEEGLKHSQNFVDPADSKEVSKAISSNSFLTDKSDWLSSNLTSARSKIDNEDTNKIIKFHGTKVDNVIIHYTSRSWDNPEMIAISEFNTSKITGKFETINIQAIADYITITFYKQERSNLILRREMIPAYKVEHIWIKDTK